VFQGGVPPHVPPGPLKSLDKTCGTQDSIAERTANSGTRDSIADTNHENPVRVGDELRSPSPAAPAEAGRAHSLSPEEEAMLKELLEIWPIGEDEDLAGELFEKALASDGNADTILANARKYLEITESRYWMPLERWLRTNKWVKPPIDRRPKEKSGGKKAGQKGDAGAGDKKTRQGQGSAAVAGRSAIVNLTPDQRQDIARRRSEGEEYLMDIAASYGVPSDLVVARELAYEELKSRYDAKGNAFATLADKFNPKPTPSRIDEGKAFGEILIFRERVIKPSEEFYKGLPHYEPELDPVYHYLELLMSIADQFEEKHDRALDTLYPDDDGADETAKPTADGAKVKARHDLFLQIFSKLDEDVREFELYCARFSFSEAEESDLNDGCDVMEAFADDVLQRAIDFEESLPVYYDPASDPVHGFVETLGAMYDKFSDKVCDAQRRIEGVQAAD
jgi:hypothetical protein